MRRGATAVLGLSLLALAACNGKRPAADAPRQAETSKVRITSVPTGAAVLEDGQRVGQTPLTLKRIAMARLSLEIVKDGYQLYRVRKLVEEGRTTRLHAVLRPEEGTLIVRSGLLRGVRITVDGQDRGRTPTRVTVSAGADHAVVLEKDGFQPYRTTARVAAGETETLEGMMIPLGRRFTPGGYLTVRSDVPAEVQLNGSPLGNTPVEKILLPARRYQLLLKNTQMGLEKRVQVRVEVGKTREVEVLMRGK